MIGLSIFITISYLILIGAFSLGFDKVKVFSLKNHPSKTNFSVLIPFRNEAENLPKLLKSIQALSYPKQLFEIILINDASEDDSEDIVNYALAALSDDNIKTIRVVQNERYTPSPKKDAIVTGIRHANFEWIITTDADCALPKHWLNCYDELIQSTPLKCIAAPVTYFDDSTFLNRFQILDMFSLQGTTIAGFGLNQPFLCNGANFAYAKTAFQAVNGFEGNNHISSGDDTFLLEKFFKAFPKSIGYLKSEEAIVKTAFQPNWHQLLQQRIRWAAKARAYNNWLGILTGSTVLLMNLQLAMLPILSVLGYFNFKIWIYILVIKLHIDFLLLYKTSAFFGQRHAFKSFLTSFFLYPLFSIYVAFTSFFKGFNWKGRDFKL